MPYSTQRANQNQDNVAYSSSENPVFQIKLRGLDNDNEQSATTERGVDSEKTRHFKVGDFVKGKDKNSSEIIKGKIIEYDDDKGKVVILDDKNKKKVSVDFSSLVSLKSDSKVDRGEKFKTKTVPEHKFFEMMNFTEFKAQSI